jgi:hypothetical protein
MSDNVQSQGYFGKLKTPVGDSGTDAWEDLNEILYAKDLYLNYDGTMIFSDVRSNSYDCGLIFAIPNGATQFRQKCQNLGHGVDPVKHYSCVWYNGADSPMSTATLNEVFP